MSSCLLDKWLRAYILPSRQDPCCIAQTTMHGIPIPRHKKPMSPQHCNTKKHTRGTSRNTKKAMLLHHKLNTPCTGDVRNAVALEQAALVPQYQQNKPSMDGVPRARPSTRVSVQPETKARQCCRARKEVEHYASRHDWRESAW